MELASPTKLRDLILNSNRELTFKIILQIASGICRAMVYLLQRSIVHGDIDSRHVCVGTDNEPKLTFGYERLIGMSLDRSR